MTNAWEVEMISLAMTSTHQRATTHANQLCPAGYPTWKLHMAYSSLARWSFLKKNLYATGFVYST